MKRFARIALIFAVLFQFALAVVPAYAVNIFPGCTSSGTKPVICGDVTNAPTNPVIDAMRTTITILAIIIGVASIIIIVLNGLKLIVSGGDSNQVAKSRNAILYALVGIVVAIFSQSIVLFVLDRLS